MLTKLKNNNKGGADLQFAIAVFLFMFVVCMALILDFWFVSSAKISVLKAVQQAELYCLISNAPVTNELGGNDASADYSQMQTANLSSFQNQAVSCTVTDLPDKIEGFPYIKYYDVLHVQGLSDTIGQMGVMSIVRYRINTLMRSPRQIFGFMDNTERGNLTDDDIDAKNWVNLKVTTKLVPIISDKTIAKS